MRNVLITTAALVALAMPAEAAKTVRHSWFNVDYPTATCTASTQTPEETLDILRGPIGRGEGYENGRIAPEDVVKTGNGQIHVTIRATLNGAPNTGNFFTSKDMCDDFVKQEHIEPSQAPHDDIN